LGNKRNCFVGGPAVNKPVLFKLKDKDKSDEKYIIAQKITRISQEYDKLGGNERIAG
jgi:hypothetical protein